MNRTCEHCHKPITRRGNEDAQGFRRRKFCDTSCANTHRRAVQLQAASDRLTIVIEEADFLRGTDSPEHLAARLGYTNTESLARVLARVGRWDLASWFHSAGVPA